MSSTLGNFLGSGDQLPDLRLMSRNSGPLYTSRHRPEALPPLPFLVLLPQIINGVGGFSPLLILG